jgi:hypothetical protein
MEGRENRRRGIREKGREAEKGKERRAREGSPDLQRSVSCEL